MTWHQDLLLAQTTGQPPISTEWLGFIVLLVSAAGAFLVLRNEVKHLWRTLKEQREDMNAMDAKFTQVEREWRNWYGGGFRAAHRRLPGTEGGPDDPDEP